MELYIVDNYEDKKWNLIFNKLLNIKMQRILVTSLFDKREYSLGPERNLVGYRIFPR